MPDALACSLKMVADSSIPGTTCEVYRVTSRPSWPASASRALALSGS